MYYFLLKTLKYWRIENNSTSGMHLYECADWRLAHKDDKRADVDNWQTPLEATLLSLR